MVSYELLVWLDRVRYDVAANLHKTVLMKMRLLEVCETAAGDEGWH